MPSTRRVCVVYNCSESSSSALESFSLRLSIRLMTSCIASCSSPNSEERLPSPACFIITTFLQARHNLRGLFTALGGGCQLLLSSPCWTMVATCKAQQRNHGSRAI